MKTNFRKFIPLLVAAMTTAATVSKPDTAAQATLLQLVANHFCKLSLAEEMLVNAAANGETAHCTALSGNDKNIRGDLLSWLCTDPQATAQVTYRGISVVGAEVVKEVDLKWAKISFPIRASDCVFNDGIDLANSHIAFLGLTNSIVTDLEASEAHFEGSVDLKDTRVTDGVSLVGATIDGNLKCDGGHFIGKGTAPALNATGAEVKGNVSLLNDFKACGGVVLTAARIDRDLDCKNSKFISKGKIPAIDANGVEVKGSVFLSYDGFEADGRVNLAAAKIDGSLDCVGGKFIANDKELAFFARNIVVKGSVLLRNVVAKGGVDLVRARINGNLECDGSQFVEEGESPALSVNTAEVNGNVYLRKGLAPFGFKAEGKVDLVGTKIDGNLDCEGGQFIGKDAAPALDASTAKIEGFASFKKGFADGKVELMAARVAVGLIWYHINSPEKATLDLHLTKVGTLQFSRDSWPTQGHLYLDGLTYDQIDSTPPPDVKTQLGWLKLQPQDNRFLSQPFEQLAGVLRKMGLEEDARVVMIAKNQEQARYVQWRPEWLWYGLFGHLIGYGYSPWRAFDISLIVIGIGWWLFRRGYRRGLVTPTGDTEYNVEKDGVHLSSTDYPQFDAFIYSLETFVPLVKLGIGEHWSPNANRNALAGDNRLRFPPKTGRWLRCYLWFHIIAGWVLSALWVGGITGLAKT